MPQSAITTVATNVPGLDRQLYLLGRPIREILPYVPIAERLRIGVAVFILRSGGVRRHDRLRVGAGGRRVRRLRHRLNEIRPRRGSSH
ncbi:WS/DGAT domain-containing protein [Krasilnikovia cinnamomea]|uniref:WS/DGAT domain-containing protein n=1 Tax=Krasilnikovia cinnamomea TaxID=349313 RepID=UPI0013EEFF16